MAATIKDVEPQLCPEGLGVPRVGGKVNFQVGSMTLPLVRSILIGTTTLYSDRTFPRGTPSKGDRGSCTPRGGP